MRAYTLIVPALALALAVPATAQEISVRVDYSDLDLTSKAGVDRLDDRLDDAVQTVCGDKAGLRPISEVMAISKCSRETRANIAGSRQFAISKARGQVPSVELASAGSAGKLTVRRR